MKVFIPTPLRSYTGDRSEVEASGATIAEVLADLDRNYPGIRFRMVDEAGRVRPHVQVFVGGAIERDPAAPLPPDADVFIVGALSGG